MEHPQILDNKMRCIWVKPTEPIYVDYHDNIWGVPQYDSIELFKFLNLEGMQAGLSWITILKKIDGYIECFDAFDPYIIAKYSEERIIQLMQDQRIIRNQLKIKSIVNNAQAYINLIEVKKISFSEYIWSFVGGKPLINHWQDHNSIPNTTSISDKMSRDLKSKGSTIWYSFMQAVGMVNDHVTSCFRHNECR
jgi:DNA-3-methyladenine glycosylase I